MMKNYRKILKWTLWVLLCFIVARVFLFQATRVDDFHMASTLIPGDRVIVNKFRAGLRLPISIIGLPGTNAPYVDGVRLPYLRLPAFKKLQHDDVVVFNYPIGSDKPIDRKRLMVSRIIGLPTDTVMIRDKIVSVNNIAISPPKTRRAEYRVVTDSKPISKEFLHSFQVEEPRTIADIGIYDVDLSDEAAVHLEKTAGVKTVRETKQFLGDASADYYPASSFFGWNRDQFGPFIVPSIGMTVAIDIRTIDFYRDLIETHEKHSVMVDFSGIKIDGNPIDSYTFEKNYYFVLSDNRDNPDDGRKFGFVPADHILGVAKRIIWSSQNDIDYIGKLHPGRIFKGIR
jgi:signal peptidase I